LVSTVFVLGGLAGPPAARPPGAGLPPVPFPRPAEVDANAARRAEIAAEEAQLAALRATRRQVEQEIAALRGQVQTLRGEQTQPAPQPVATIVPPEPGGRSLRVFVHHRAGSPADAAEAVAQTVRDAGMEVSALRPAPFVPSTPVVRYFYEEDQAAAARLAARLGRGWAIQDFRAYVPQPAPQTLEVWLPGS